MRRKEVLSVSLLVTVFVFSFFALAYSHGNMARSSSVLSIDNVQPFILSAPLISRIGFNEDPHLLDQSTRVEIYNFVKNNPGIHFRGICDNLDLPIGVVQYHLGLLVSAGLLSTYRERRYKRYFESKRFGQIEMKIISILRHETAGKILALLSERGSIFHKDLASNLDISSQALTWQIKRLRKTGLIETVKVGMQVEYLLNEENASTVKKLFNFRSDLESSAV